MSEQAEIIALLLGETGDGDRHAKGFSAGAQRLVRHANGRVALEAVGSEDEFARALQETGCFRRGKPIQDPATREVIGYEMEEVLMRRARARA